MLKEVSIDIRKATLDDVIGIVYVQATTWIDSYPNSDYDIEEEDLRAIDWHSKITGWQHMIKSPDFHVWVAARAQEILGFAALVSEPGRRLLDALYVLPSHQREGIGLDLLQAVLETINESELRLQVAVYNRQAIDFYTKHEFETTGSEGGNYHLPGGKVIPTKQMVLRSKNVRNKLETVNRKKLAKISGCRDSTIKWYSEIGLLTFTQEASGMRRRYPLKESLQRLHEVQERQKKGEKIEDILQDLAG